MFFILSKVLWMVAAPTNLLVGSAAVGSLAARAGRPWGTGLAVVAILALVACGSLPGGRRMLRPLEDRFPAPALDDSPAPAGIVVLGGAIDQVVGAARGQVTMGDAGTRLTAGAALARRFPDAVLVYTGGSNALVDAVVGEAQDARRLWIDLGIAPGRIRVEDASRNTEENARFTRDLLHPGAGQRWLLVTSAYHMPRSVGLFRAAGFDIVPVPVDYRSTGTWRDLLPTTDLAAGLQRLDVATREWTGLLAYRLSGRIADILPSPWISGTVSSSGSSSDTACRASEANCRTRIATTTTTVVPMSTSGPMNQPR